MLAAVLIAAGVFVGVTLGWDYSPGDYSYSDIDFTAAGTETGECSFVSVQVSTLNVNVYSTTDKTVTLSASGTKAAERVSAMLEDGVLRITEKKLGFFDRLLASSEASLIVRIPEKWIGTVDAASTSGDVYIGSLQNAMATVRAASTSGDVSASDLRAEALELNTVSGNAHVYSYRGGSVTASTTSGYVSLSDVKAESASLSSVSGSLALRNADISGAVTVHTTSGDIDLDDVAAASVSGDSTSGDLGFFELDTQSFVFTATSGDISGELLHAEEFGGTIRTVSGDISGLRPGGEGTRTLQLETTSGDIEIND